MMKRKRPSDLGVLEFTSALNGEDPHVILQKLRHFVHIVRYQRRVALGADDDGSDMDDGDEESACSLFDQASSKRQKIDEKTPTWQLDKNDYRVPFVGTSVARGDVGSVVVGNWPTGFLEVYQKHSPMGVELVRNDYISALPPNGIHRTLVKGSATDAGKRAKNDNDKVELSEDQIISLSIQNYYWMALSEWVLGFVSMDTLKRDLYWEANESNPIDPLQNQSRDIKSSKCAIAPEMMTILMKNRMPEWIEVINDYTYQQHLHNQQLIKTKQQQKQQRKKQGNQSKEEQQIQTKIQQQQAEKLKQQQLKWENQQRRGGVLLTCAIQNLKVMCFLSLGTAREVLRRLSITNSVASKNVSAAGNKSKVKSSHNTKGQPFDGTNWMVQLLQQKPLSTGNTPASEYCNPQVECLNLVCTLLETKDYAILSRMGQAPPWSLKQSNRAGRIDNSGLLYIGLRYGMQYLLESINHSNDGKQHSDELDRVSQSFGRLLRGVRDNLLPIKKEVNDKRSNQRIEGFILGVGATADLLSGDVLINLTKLALLAPTCDANMGCIKNILYGEDSYEGTSSVDLSAIEARRLLFVLLSDIERSPFLKIVCFRDRSDQLDAHFSQLSRALHSLLLDHGNSAVMKMFLRMCLDTTPQLLPYVFQGLHLSEPKPNYHTLSSLSFVNHVIADAPSPEKVLPSLNAERDTVSSKTILSFIIPTCITKVLLGKVVQSTSALLVSSGLKLIITVLQRANNFVSALKDFKNDGNDDSKRISELQDFIRQAVLRHLPQISLLLSIPTRFDPFAETASKANAVVIIELCKAIQYYGQFDPSLIDSVQFDWVKLLPLEIEGHDQEPLRSFMNAEACGAVSILQLLKMISRLDDSSSLKMLAQVFSILTATKVPEIHDAARDLAFHLIKKELLHQRETNISQYDGETLSCNAYEGSLWVDEITEGIIQDLISWIRELHRQRVQHKIFVSQALSNSGMGGYILQLGVSELFSFLISKLIQNDAKFSNEFSLLLIGMTIKILLFQSNPKPLASIIVYASEIGAKKNTECNHLINFASSILRDGVDMNRSLNLLPFTMFNLDDGVEIDINSLVPRHDSGTLRQCLSLMKYQTHSYHSLSSLFRRILVCSIEKQDNMTDIASLIMSAFKRKILDAKDLQCVATLLLIVLGSKSSSISFLLAMAEQSSVEAQLTCAILQLSSSATASLPCVVNYLLKQTVSLINCVNSSSDLRGFLLHILPELIPSRDRSIAPRLPPDIMFNLWIALSKLDAACSNDLCLRLEDSLSQLFNKSGDEKGQYTVYRLINVSPELFIETCFNTAKKWATSCQGKAILAAGRFLSAVLAYDCSSFGCLTRSICKIKHDDNITDLWNGGHLDLLAATFLYQTQEQSNTGGITADPNYNKVLSLIGQRLTFSLEKNQSSSVSLQQRVYLLEKLCVMGKMPTELESKLLDISDTIEAGSRAETIEDEIQLIKLVNCVCDKRKNGLLLTHAFVRCCKMLPKLLKSFVKNEQSSFNLLVMLTSQLSIILKRATNFDQVIVSSCSNIIDKMIVACLKYGIYEGDDSSTRLINGECLKIVGCTLKVPNSICSFIPSQIHSMVVSHSSFQSVASRYVGETTTQQVELIRLLTNCVSLDSKLVKIDSDTLLTILSAYNASPRKVDKMLRRLIYLYEAHGCFEGDVLMSHCRWGAFAARQRGHKDDQGWEWLLDALDSERIRSTLIQYPVSDVLDPLPDMLAEETNNKTDSSERGDDDSFLDDEMEEDDSRASRSNNSSNRERAASNLSSDEWRGSGEDNRYSPGFILPLILGALEEYMPTDLDARSESPKSVNEIQDNDRNNEDTEDNREKHRAFCYFSRRLCDKGVIALILASLSSRCPSIRKMACAILGLFIRAIHLPESQAIKSWHERPQLVMLLSAVQRGMAIRRAMQIQKAKDAHDFSPINTPMLPAVAAVFLAKSVMIISRPGDEMYGPINRYFLRLNDFHGAFQDCFTLPAFLSLYCNSSDDISRCKLERNWALLALKDGTVDEFCYRIICQSHIPELIMSSLDSSMGNPDCTAEVSLTIDVVSSLITAGGSGASNHMINRLGILSWLNGIINWRQISTVLPYVALKCKFLGLVTTTIQSYNAHSTTETPFYEMVPLSNTVIRICLENYSDELGKEQDVNDLSLLQSTCDALWEIYLACQKGFGDIIPRTVCGQTTVDDMTVLMIKFVSQQDMFRRILSSLCILPFVATGDGSLALTFCKLALGHIIYHTIKKETSSKLVRHVLQRVHDLMVRYPQLEKDDSISTLVLKCRRLAVFEDGGIQVWENVMTLIEDNKHLG